MLLKTELNCILSLCSYCFVLSLVTFLNLAVILYCHIPINIQVYTDLKEGRRASCSLESVGRSSSSSSMSPVLEVDDVAPPIVWELSSVVISTCIPNRVSINISIHHTEEEFSPVIFLVTIGFYNIQMERSKALKHMH
jgi:hypothetical protein